MNLIIILIYPKQQHFLLSIRIKVYCAHPSGKIAQERKAANDKEERKRERNKKSKMRKETCNDL
jgi:hypothetical protein